MKLSLQQKALWYWALYKDDFAVVTYKKDNTGQKYLSKTLKTAEEEAKLLNDFHKNPKEVLAYCRINLQKIAKDTKLSDIERKDRSERYIKEYLDFIIKLDAEAFVHDQKKVYNWIPDYIPDGFVDMWSDSVLNTEKRNREKIIISKKEIFREEKDLLYKILSSPNITKKDMINYIFHTIRNKKYNYDVANDILWWKSIQMHDIIKKELFVCRHKALLFQILAQACWLTSRLLKCNVIYHNNSWSHVANLIRVNNKRYLLDTTAWMITIDGKRKSYIVSIPQNEIDLNKNTYKWEIKNDKGIHKYTSRNNAYYQIR